jgi:hypothetical protein
MLLWIMDNIKEGKGYRKRDKVELNSFFFVLVYMLRFMFIE